MLSGNERHVTGKGPELITSYKASMQYYVRGIQIFISCKGSRLHMKITLVNIRIVPTLKVAFYQPICNLLEYILILLVNIGEAWENPS